MLFRGSISIAIAKLVASMATAQAFDDRKYPDLFGVWGRVNLRPGGQPSFDLTRPWGRGQQAPLTTHDASHCAACSEEPSPDGRWSGTKSCH